MAKIFLDVSGNFTVNSNNSYLYGSSGSELVTIAAGVTGAVFDQNTEKVLLTDVDSNYRFAQAGNQIRIYDGTGATLLASIPVQGDADGTALTFANGTAQAIISAGVMKLGGATVGTAAAAVTPVTIDMTTVTPPGGTASAGKAKIFLEAGDSFMVSNNNAALYGSTGSESVTVASGTAGLTFDQNTERVSFTGASSSYLFAQAGNQIKVYDSAATLLAAIPVQGDSDGTGLTFSNGTFQAAIGAGVMKLGSATLGATPAAVTLVPGSTLRASSAVQTLTGTDGADDVFIAVGVTAAGQYQGSDSNFSNLASINGNSVSEINSGDKFDGGTGNDTLHVYGTADLAGATLAGIERVVLHSDVTFSAEQMEALNSAKAAIIGDGASIMRMTPSINLSTVNMSNIELQAIGQFDLADNLTAQISQLGLNQIGTVSAGTGAVIQAGDGTPGGQLDFTGKTVYGPGSVKDVNGTSVGALDAVPGLSAHLNNVVSSVAAMVDSMNTLLAAVPGYTAQDKVNLDVASMKLYAGSQTEADVVMAGSDGAFLRGGAFGDTLIGGSGTNFLSGAAGNDTLTGGALRDFIAGNEGDDNIDGLAGNDFLNSESGNDTINGGAGLDFIMPGDGSDTVILTADPDFISLYSSSASSVTDNAADVVKFVTDGALAGGPSIIVGFEAARDVVTFESKASASSGITGINAGAGNATISAAVIAPGFNMNTAAPGGILILTDNSFARGDAASANSLSSGYDAIIAMSAGTPAGAGIGHLIAVNDTVGNTNIFYDSDGSTTANNWQLVVKLIGVTATELTAGSLQVVNEV